RHGRGGGSINGDAPGGGTRGVAPARTSPSADVTGVSEEIAHGPDLLRDAVPVSPRAARRRGNSLCLGLSAEVCLRRRFARSALGRHHLTRRARWSFCRWARRRSLLRRPAWSD